MPEKQRNVPRTKEKQTEKAQFPIVGIGASAGGLETLNTFFDAMPPDCNLAFVVIQHLSPQHISIMASLLDKHTRMSVMQIEDGIQLEPNHVYLNPPGKNVAIFNRSLYLMEPRKRITINMPVDFFFRSLSEDQKENAIGIILSGTASDGTQGVKSIKGEGGMVMVQQPDTAKHDGMPRSAIETGLVDFILTVEEMPKKLINFVQHPLLESLDKTELTEQPIKNQLQKIIMLIRAATGHDFSHYKPSTITRRVERRLAVHQLKNLAEYILFLQETPAEMEVLFKNLIIGVTSFMRDSEAFGMLEQEVLPKLLSNKKLDTTIRIWVTGCSTGEEAYSLAIILSEAMDKLRRHFNVQIFATDIDETALDTARKGIYPESIASDISRERLNQFFLKEPNAFKIKKQLRDMVVFSVQNIIKDPPFSRLDMVTCRNLLIYMDSVLQKKIIPLFHYTLNPGGILFLGSSESIGRYTDLFHPINSKWKIFERKIGSGDTTTGYLSENSYPFQHRNAANEKEKLPDLNKVRMVVERTLLDGYTPAGVLIDDQYNILHFVGKTDRYLMPPTGEPRFNILNMAREGIRHHLTIALHTAFQKKTNTFCTDVSFQYNGDSGRVDISIKQMADKGLSENVVLVVFEDKTMPKTKADKKPGPKKTGKKDVAVQRLEDELQSTKEYLQATIEELETSNEELKSTNEELQSVNEELQSTNEELETSKEELQSTNEELATVNAELQNKVDEFSKTNNDMNNLLAATEIASIFLDTDLRIKRYTPAAAKVVNLIHSDIGRPLTDLTTSFMKIDLVGMASKVLKDLNTTHMEILSTDSIWFEAKVMPYRTTENVIGGVVMTFVNVHKVKQADKIRRLATVLDDSNDAVTVLDLTGRILAWNKGARKMYGWTESEALEMNISQLLPKKNQQEFDSVLKSLSSGKPIQAFKSQRKTKSGKVIEVWLTVTVLTDERGRPNEIATTERDLALLKEK